jgi:predicted aminopeptidase
MRRWMRLMRSLLADVILLPAIAFCLLNPSLLVYALKMGKGQAAIIINARPFEEVYDDPDVDLVVKEKLRTIERIKQFAYDSIGLKTSNNYSSFYQQPEDQIIFVVTACEKFKLRPFEWSFPVVGTLPYKGYFNKEEAQAEANRLKSFGYDVNVGNASGWSTLGWFNDPVLSQMLKLPEGELAELIIHELTHGTVFIPDSAEYNENLATFVGVNGAVWYLTSVYGKDSPEYREYIDSGSDADLRTDFMLSCAKYADSVYASIPAKAEPTFRINTRLRLFDTIAARAARLPLKSDTTYALRLRKHLDRSGNTILMNYVRYSGKQSDFELDFLKSGQNLRIYLGELIKKFS